VFLNFFAVLSITVLWEGPEKTIWLKFTHTICENILRINITKLMILPMEEEQEW
jgi:hypothetical protein